jgi:hypothetical protein
MFIEAYVTRICVGKRIVLRDSYIFNNQNIRLHGNAPIH